MSTILMKINGNHIAPKKVFDMKNYRLPRDRQKVRKLPPRYEALPRKSHGVDFDIYDYEMLFNDEGTKKIIREGKTIGCFYIESPGMRSLLRRLGCDTFEMLTAASSVIRPGVAESGMMQEFIASHKNPQRRKYLVPEMQKYLGETYGVMVYQEDVIKIAHHIAGLSLEEADLLRRAMSGKMRSRDAMQQVAGKFYQSCRKHGLGENVTKELWRQISSFAGYSFCKAHSASFALLSFQVAFLKVHYPAEFMSSVLSNGGGFYSAAVYVQECKRLRLKVELPSVNKSDYEYKGEKDTITIGFLAVKGLSRKTAAKIVQQRKVNGKYFSLADFLVRTKSAYEETANLIRCGAMDCFDKTRPTLMRLLDVYIKHRNILDESDSDLFPNESLKLEDEVITDTEYGIAEICSIEYETFGYMVSRHPLEFFPDAVNSSKVVKAADMHKYNDRKVWMVGWYMTSKRIKTKKGDIMKFLSLEDLTDTFEAVLFPKTYDRYAEQTLSMGPYLVEGKVDMENGNNIVVERLKVLSAQEIKTDIQKDSTENNYFGDVEKFYEEEVSLVNALGKDKLKKAYL